MSIAIAAGGAYETTLVPWVAQNSATVTRDSTNPCWGSWAAKVVTGGAGDFEGLSSTSGITTGATILASTQHTLSVYVDFPSGEDFTVFGAQYTAAGAHVANVQDTFTGTDDYQRAAVTFTSGATGVRLVDLRVMSRVVAASRTFFVDGWQLDQAATAQTYDGTDAVVAMVAPIMAGNGVRQPGVACILSRA
ncbi:MAG TPA: hypothetical protein VE645_18910 [Pseudonocardiaceae bacterium]|nr:hypothetical protein [Pseudonocardiaceae bacterium]